MKRKLTYGMSFCFSLLVNTISQTQRQKKNGVLLIFNMLFWLFKLKFCQQKEMIIIVRVLKSTTGENDWCINLEIVVSVWAHSLMLSPGKQKSEVSFSWHALSSIRYFFILLVPSVAMRFFFFEQNSKREKTESLVLICFFSWINSVDIFIRHFLITWINQESVFSNRKND